MGEARRRVESDVVKVNGICHPACRENPVASDELALFTAL